MRIISMFLVMCLMTLRVFADGTIAGKVNDEKTGDAIIGATIIVKGTAKGAATDVDGNFSVQVPEGTYTVEIKYIGYQAKEISEVEVMNNATVSLNATITEAKNTQLNEVVVRSSIKKENVSALYIMQKNSAVVSSGISADVIQRSPDRNTGEVLKRVSGASIKDNKYVVIRGLSDRYNLAMVNNALMPSTEPDKKAFSFDVIPSNLIDNIVITKTATPDLPGDFAGGVVQVATKDVPEDDFLNVGIGAGYNTQSTFKDITSNGRSAGDYLGFPGKESKLPSSFGNDYTEYRGQSLANRIAAAKELPNGYKEVTSSGMPNMSLQASGGKVVKFKNGAKFGAVAGVSYRNSLNYDPTYERHRFDDGQVLNQLYTDKYSKMSSSLAAIANASYVAGKSKISFKNLYNKLYDNVYYQREGFSVASNQQILGSSSIPSERQIFNTQLEGDHAFGKKNMKVNWNLNYSNLTADQRDLRTAFYNRNTTFDEQNYPINSQEAYVVNERNSRRFFSNQKDHNYGGTVNYSLPFELFKNKQTLKAGYMASYKTRSFGARVFQYKAAGSTIQPIASLPVNEIFAVENLNPNGFELDEITNPTDEYKASGFLNAGYLMLDNNFSEKWRLTWGVRVESYTQNIDAIDLSKNVIDKTDNFLDILPSANLTYSLNEKSKLRLGLSRTVNRPEFREIAPFQFIDFENLWTIQGNENLVRANINNIDLRYDYYPSPGEAITIGAFYKNFENPIEAVMDAQSNLDLFIFGYQNAPSANSMGAELDVRKNLSFLGSAKWLNNLVLGANFTYIYSRVDVGSLTGVAGRERPLQGQSPYLINVSALYNDPKSGLALSAMYNRVGHRIYIVGNASIPTTWENGRDVIDLQISKPVLKKRGEVKLTVGDILNQPTTYYWNTDGKDSYKAGNSVAGKGNDQVFQQFQWGTTFTLGFNYRLAK